MTVTVVRDEQKVFLNIFVSLSQAVPLPGPYTCFFNTFSIVMCHMNFYDLLHVVFPVSSPVIVLVFLARRNTNENPGDHISIKCPGSVSLINLSLCLHSI